MSSPRLTIEIPPDYEQEYLPSPPSIKKSRFFEMEEFSETDDSDIDEPKEEPETETCWTMFIKLFKLKKD
jgi:hypothetical protein